MTLCERRLGYLLGERSFQYHRVADSTQDIALKWLQQGAPTGSLVIADEQLKGRGRHGRIWHTPPGVAIALSIILRPPLEALSRITMLGAVAIYDVLDELGATEITIKWPNDVRLSGRKVCGVLPELVWQGDRLLGVSLGIGINVRTSFAGSDLDELATSIEPEIGRTVDRAELIATLVQRIDFWQMRSTSPKIFDTWRSRLETIGCQVVVAGISGFATGVDEDGALCVRDASGVVHRILAGDVALN